MELRVLKQTHTFLCMVVVLVCCFILLSPLAPVFAAVDVNGNGVIDSWEVTTSVDTNGNGAIDSWEVTNGGIVDTGLAQPGEYGTGGQYSSGGNGGGGADSGGQAGGGSGVPVTAATGNAASMSNTESFVYGLTIQIGGWVAGLGGNALEISFRNFVIKLGCYFAENNTCKPEEVMVTNGAIGGVVNELWKVIRDLFNVVFIFALVYLGFQLILNSDSGGAKKTLGSLVYAALLVNFSLYIAKFILDVANFCAVQIYSAMQITGTYSIDNAFQFGANYQIAGAFMETLQVASFFKTDGLIEGAQSIMFGIMAMIFLIFLGAIFLYGAFMIFARFIAIVLLLILSPAMFLGWVLPSFSSYSTKWRKMFMAYCFFAPAYVFMLYLSLYVLKQIGDPLKDASYAKGFAGGAVEPTAFNIYVFFFIGAGFLFASTKVAASMASAGAGATMNMASGWAKTLSVGAAGYATGYVPRVATNWAGSKTEAGIDNAQTWRGLNPKGLAGAIARTRGFDAVSRSGADKLKNVQLGTGSTNEKEAKRSKEIADNAKKTQAGYDTEAKQAATITLLNDDTRSAEHAKEIAKLSPSAVVAMMKDKDGAKAIEKHAALLRPDQIKALQDDKELGKKEVNTIAKTRTDAIKGKYPTGADIGKANADDLQLFDMDVLEKPEYAINLSEAKIDKLPATKFTEAEKQTIKDNRKKALVDVVTIGTSIGGVSSAGLAKLKADDLAALPDAVFDSNNGVNANVEAFVNQIKLSKMATIQTKKGDAVAENIRNILRQNQSADVVDWLENDRVGKNFGK